MNTIYYPKLLHVVDKLRGLGEEYMPHHHEMNEVEKQQDAVYKNEA